MKHPALDVRVRYSMAEVMRQIYGDEEGAGEFFKDVRAEAFDMGKASFKEGVSDVPLCFAMYRC